MLMGVDLSVSIKQVSLFTKGLVSYKRLVVYQIVKRQPVGNC